MRKLIFTILIASATILPGFAQQTTTVDSSQMLCHAEEVPSRATTIIKANVAQRGKDTVKMVYIKGGTFQMGSSNFADAKPVHEVTLSPFYMDEHEVTNDQYAAFVKATGYITVAERPLDPKEFPNVDPKLLVPGSAVFKAPNQVQGMQNHLQWWDYVPGANWRHPEGPESTIDRKS